MMTKNACDRNRLLDVLSEQLPSQQLAVAYEHLEGCADCRATLDSLAAEAGVWNSLPRFLRSDDADPVEPLSQFSLEPLSHEDRDFMSLAVENVIQGLEESENPAMLGRLGEYDVLEVIGCGGMGVVLKGYDRALNRYVAIKTLATHLASNTPARKRFAREAKAAAAVVHQHVVAVHAVEGAAKLPYFVMQFVSGNSLAQRIDAEAPMDLRDILRIGAQAAAGLSAAHQQGLVHRDVKPSNILLENDVERVLLTDFGLARTIDDAHMTHSGVLAGTPQFMSPEQAIGCGLDPRSDLFSLGSVLYMMCTGHSPFRADSTMGVLRRITDEPHRPVRQVNPDIPTWLELIIDRLLEKAPEDRYQSAASVSELLSQWLAHVQQPDAIPRPSEPVIPPPSARLSGDGNFGAFVGKGLKWTALASFGFLAGILVLLELGKGRLVVESEAANVPIRITRNGDLVKKMTVSQSGASIRVAAGEYVIEIDGDYEGLLITESSVRLQRGGIDVVRVIKKSNASDSSASPLGSSTDLLSASGEVLKNLPRENPLLGLDANRFSDDLDLSVGEIQSASDSLITGSTDAEVSSAELTGLGELQPGELEGVIGSDIGEPVYNEALKRFKFHLEWMTIEGKYETAEYFYRLYVDRGHPPVLGAWGDPETNSIVVIGPPEAEQAIRDTLAEWEGQHTGVDFRDDNSFEAQRQKLRDSQRRQLQRIAQLEGERIDLELHLGADGKDRMVKLDDEIFTATEHLEAVERKLSVLEKQMERFDEWQADEDWKPVAVEESSDAIQLLSKSESEIRVLIPEWVSDGKLTIRNQAGEQVSEYSVKGKGVVSLSTKTFPPGDYTVNIQDESAESQFQFKK